MLPKRSTFVLFVLAAFAGAFFGTPRRLIIIVSLVAMLAVFLGFIMAVWLVIGLKRDAEVPAALRRTFGASMTFLFSAIIFVITASATHYLPDRL